MATNAKKDDNGRAIAIAVSSANGETITPVYADPTDHSLAVDDDTGGTDNGNHGGIAMVDENGTAVLTALSSDDDGTIIELYVDPLTKKLLINSN